MKKSLDVKTAAAVTGGPTTAGRFEETEEMSGMASGNPGGRFRAEFRGSFKASSEDCSEDTSDESSRPSHAVSPKKR